MIDNNKKITRIIEKIFAAGIIITIAIVSVVAINKYLPQNLSKLSADVSATNGWQQEGDDWYYYENGTMIVSNWKQIDNYWYYFDDNGKMVKEWQQINNYWYYFGTDGRMRINWQQINTIWYYFGSDGKMKTGWVRVNDHSYYLTKYYREFDNNVQGQLVTGRRKIDGSYYYLCEKDAVAGYPEGAMLHNASYNGYSYYENGKEGLGPTTYYDTTLPSYYDSVLPNTISQIQSKTSINGALSFIYITDQHFYANSRNNAELIRRVYNNSNISYVFNGGDVNYAYGTEFERDLDVNNFIQFSDSLLSNNIDVYSVKGNHDYTTKQSKDSDVRYTLDPVAEYNVLMQGTKASNVHGPVNKAYYYYDDTANRVRYIVLDVFERDANPGYLMTGYFTDAQFNWFKDALTSIQNYNIVVFTHAPVDPNIQYYERSVSFIHDVEAAINNKNTYTYTYKEGNLAGTTTTLNFTNTTNRVLANISGHGHEDAAAFTDNVLSVETTSDAYYNDDPNTPRQKNSVTEHAFDVYTIDFNGKKIYTTRVGAGVNRSFDFPSEISMIDIPTCSAKTYNGTTQTLMTNGTGYTVTNNTGANAGNYTVTVTPNQYYKWSDGTTQSKEVTCIINPKELDQSKFTVTNTSKEYDGNNTSNISLTVTAESGLISGDSVSISYESATYNNINVANATTINVSEININNNNYTLISTEQSYPGTITRKQISIPTCSAKTYNRQEQTLFEVHTSGQYTNTELSGTNAGDYIVTVTPTSNYKWGDDTTTGKEVTCTINPLSMVNASVVPISEYTYDGTAKEPVPSILVNDTILNSTDYDVTYSNNINAGEANVTITGKGNYTGTVNTTFAINKANGYVTLNKTSENVLYGTTSTTFEILTHSGEISISDDNDTAATSIDGNTVTINNINTLTTGTIVKVEVTSSSNQNYKQEKITYTLKITNSPITGGSVLITGNNIVGNTLTANVTDTVPVANYTYQWYRDTSQISGATSSTYTVASTDAGKTIKVEVTATKENYDSITFEDTTDVTNNKTQTVKEGVTKPTNSICNEVIYNGTSQTLATIPSSDSLKYGLLNNSGIEAGSYTLTARLNEGYIWSNGDTADVTFTCSIEKYNMQNATVEEIADQTYTGSEIRPEIVVRADSRMLQKDIDYTIEYSNNINIGTANITITGKGNYTGENSSTFNIVVDISKLNIKENKYVILDKDSTKESITELIETNVSIFRNDVEIDNTSKLATGDILRISNKEYTIVILGDTNKDGKVNIADLTRTYKIYKKTYTPNEIEFYAADSNEDERINISDLTRTYKIYKNN